MCETARHCGLVLVVGAIGAIALGGHLIGCRKDEDKFGLSTPVEVQQALVKRKQNTRFGYADWHVKVTYVFENEKAPPYEVEVGIGLTGPTPVTEIPDYLEKKIALDGYGFYEFEKIEEGDKPSKVRAIYKLKETPNDTAGTPSL